MLEAKSVATGFISKRSVDALKPTSKDQFLWDDGKEAVKGFGLKVTPAGGRIYIYQYRMGGREAKLKRYTIGKHGALTPENARKEAKRLAIMVEQGVDPAEADRIRRRDAVTLAFGDYADRFVTVYLKVNWPDSWQEGERILNRDVKPFFGDRPVTAITKADVADLLDKFVDRPAMRKNIHAVVRKLLRWSAGRGDIPISPLADTSGPKPVPARKRVLSTEELVCLWLAAEKVSDIWRPVVRLLICTLQRRGEVAGLEWSEIGGDWWMLPADRAKNDEGHRVPLTALALEQVSHLKQKRRGLLFSTTGKTPVSGFSKVKLALDSEMLAIAKERAAKRGEDPEDIEIKGWRFHDIRRTGTTMLEGLGVSIEVNEAIINHTSGSKGGVAGVYNLYRYDNEKRHALNLWAALLTQLVSGKEQDSKVVALANRRA